MKQERKEPVLPLKVRGKISQLLLIIGTILLFVLVGVGAGVNAFESGGGDAIGSGILAIFILAVGGIFVWMLFDFTLYCVFEPGRIVWQRPFRRREFDPQTVKEAWLQRQINYNRGRQNEILTLNLKFEDDQRLTLTQNEVNTSLFQLVDTLVLYYPLPIRRNHIREDIPYQQFAKGSQHEFSWYFTGQSGVSVRSVQEVCDWLRGCQYVSDRTLFNHDDHWQHPTQFEKVRRGDCEDHALWAWWKLAALGYRTEFVVGTYRDHNQIDVSHAWVVTETLEQTFLIETTEKGAAMLLPLDGNGHYFPKYGVDQNFRTYRYRTAVTP